MFGLFKRDPAKKTTKATRTSFFCSSPPETQRRHYGILFENKKAELIQE
jgi:hypothetical protein